MANKQLFGSTRGKKVPVADTVNEAKRRVAGKGASVSIRANLLTVSLLMQGRAIGKIPVPKTFYNYSSRIIGHEGRTEMLVAVTKLTKRTDKTARQLSRAADYYTIVAEQDAIGPLASKLEANDEDSSLLLNIEKESVPPFKAHRTRGTYRRRKTPIVKHKR